MARPSRPWLRLYTELLADRKVRRLDVDHRWLWVVCLVLARMSPKPGELLIADDEPVTIADIADQSGMKPARVEAGMKQLEALGMVASGPGGWSIPAWWERQYESDTSADRVRKHRVVTTKRRYNAVTVTDQNTETDTETETELLASAKRTRKPDLLWDAILAVCGIEPDQLTKSGRAAYNAAVNDIRQAGGTPEDVPRRAAVYRRRYEATLTPNALAKHWASCGQAGDLEASVVQMSPGTRAALTGQPDRIAELDRQFREQPYMLEEGAS